MNEVPNEFKCARRVRSVQRLFGLSVGSHAGNCAQFLIVSETVLSLPLDRPVCFAYFSKWLLACHRQLCSGLRIKPLALAFHLQW